MTTTTMHAAAQQGHMDVVRELLEKGENPNTQDEVCGTKKEGVSRVVVKLV
jgi:ankyrin repeat protein